jgi:mono/diheme cytochrome c family protein
MSQSQLQLTLSSPAKFAALAILLFGLLFAAAPLRAQDSKIGNLVGHANKGKEQYQRYCIGCHGVYGDGQGENAPYLDPKPRDFTLGVFKCRSTPTGSLPLDQDIFNTIGRGLDRSAMPQWLPLSPQERADLVAYIKTFSPRFRTEKIDPPVPIPPETPNNKESIDRGEKLYQVTLKCYQCHGATGSGNGPSALNLRDDKDNAIVPYQFNQPTRFKCGTTNADLYRIFMTGLDGTPMPSYVDFIKPDQAWDLVHYLRSLQQRRLPPTAPAPVPASAGK